LVTGSDAPSRVTVKVFIKKDKLTPEWVRGIARVSAVTRTMSTCAGEEQ
jgi:hypothetical protein